MGQFWYMLIGYAVGTMFAQDTTAGKVIMVFIEGQLLPPPF